MSHSSSSPVRPRKKALLIGISDAPTMNVDDDSEVDSPLEDKLLQSHQDVALIRQVLIDHHGYSHEDIVVMEDRIGIDRALFPDKRNMIRQMRKFAKGTHPGDHLFFFFAGHGYQLECHSDSETDGEDEYIETADGKSIKDNRLKRLLVDKLPPDSQLVALIDACHSGSMLDLPRQLLSPFSQHERSLVISLSSSSDNQKSFENGQGGPLAKAFAKMHQDNPNMTYRTLVSSLQRQFEVDHSDRMNDAWAMREKLETGQFDDHPGIRDIVDEQCTVLHSHNYAQRPELRSSRPFQVDALFNL